MRDLLPVLHGRPHLARRGQPLSRLALFPILKIPAPISLQPYRRSAVDFKPKWLFMSINFSLAIWHVIGIDSEL